MTVGVNSWVTIAEANFYLETEFGASEWTPLSNDIKEQCLVTAFWWIYTYPGVNIPKTSTNERVKVAQIKLAWWIYQNYDEFKKREALISSGVTRFTLSKWSENLGKVDLPEFIKDLLPILEDLGGVFPTFNRDLEN